MKRRLVAAGLFLAGLLATVVFWLYVGVFVAGESATGRVVAMEYRGRGTRGSEPT